MPVSLETLKKQLKKFGRNLADYPIMRVGDHELRAAPGVKLLTHYILTEGSTGEAYMNIIQFQGVKFFKEPRKGRAEVIVEGEKFYYNVPTRENAKMAIKGEDPDFRFRFEYPLFKKKSLVGNWRRYKRKTRPFKYPANAKNPNPIGRDFANPKEYLGMGKHQWSSLVWLKTRGMFK